MQKSTAGACPPQNPEAGDVVEAGWPERTDTCETLCEPLQTVDGLEGQTSDTGAGQQEIKAGQMHPGGERTNNSLSASIHWSAAGTMTHGLIS